MGVPIVQLDSLEGKILLKRMTRGTPISGNPQMYRCSIRWDINCIFIAYDGMLFTYLPPLDPSVGDH